MKATNRAERCGKCAVGGKGNECEVTDEAAEKAAAQLLKQSSTTKQANKSLALCSIGKVPGGQDPPMESASENANSF